MEKKDLSNLFEYLGIENRDDIKEIQVWTDDNRSLEMIVGKEEEGLIEFKISIMSDTIFDSVINRGMGRYLKTYHRLIIPMDDILRGYKYISIFEPNNNKDCYFRFESFNIITKKPNNIKTIRRRRRN